MSEKSQTIRSVEAKILSSKSALCIGRNGTFPFETACFEDLGNGDARIGFVSRKLHRRVNAGAVMPAEAVDKLAKEWLRMREPKEVLPERGEIKQYAEHLVQIAKGLLAMLEGM